MELEVYYSNSNTLKKMFSKSIGFGTEGKIIFYSSMMGIRNVFMFETNFQHFLNNGKGSVNNGVEEQFLGSRVT